MISLKFTKRSDRIATIARKAREEMSLLLGEVAQETASIARQLAPVDTGRLRASIAVMQEGELKFKIEAGAPYAAHVEFGTMHQSPQPFITPAIMLARQDLRRRLSAFGSRLK